MSQMMARLPALLSYGEMNINSKMMLFRDKCMVGLGMEAEVSPGRSSGSLPVFTPTERPPLSPQALARFPAFISYSYLTRLGPRLDFLISRGVKITSLGYLGHSDAMFGSRFEAYPGQYSAFLETWKPEPRYTYSGAGKPTARNRST